MSTAKCDLLGLYLHLARAAEQRRRLLVRDKALILAGVTAQELGLPSIAAYCRAKALAHNPGHLVGRFATLGEAVSDVQFQAFLAHQRRAFPRERVEHMLQSLGIAWEGERAAYYSDEEYAAALLGASVAEVAAGFVTPATNRAEPPAEARRSGRRGGYGLSVVAAAVLFWTAYEAGRRLGWW